MKPDPQDVPPSAREPTYPSAERGIEALADLLHLILEREGPARTSSLMAQFTSRLREAGLNVAAPVNTPYVNTIPVEDEHPYPGDRAIEQRIKSIIRWNAMAMVVQANRIHHGIGGHISTYASAATLYEVGHNHFFRGGDDGTPADQVFFQGHASSGMYARPFVEERLDADQLHRFRQELGGDGLPSYPHPYLMGDFWQFPTVSMGLGPIMSIYRARFNRYLVARGLLSADESRVWCFLGDGESDEPECLGAITLAAREQLDNLIWVVNCNLQRLDGPVRGNGKIIQELEAAFRGAGWNVIKVIWGHDWDRFLAQDTTGRLVQRMEEAVDGDYQAYSVEPGNYTRRHFFGKYPELLELVNDLSDEEIHRLRRGGHDPQKVYNAYRAAIEHQGSPSIILAKTIKGYGLGEAGEGRNVTHQQKELNERELREFRDRFQVPITDQEIAEAPFYRPPTDSPEMRYVVKRREALGGSVPVRSARAERLVIPSRKVFDESMRGSGASEASTTMAFVRLLGQLLGQLLRHPDVGQRIVLIIPDEARTFGLDALFRQVGIHSSRGQLYDPVDRANLLYYHEATDGQILEEGITEAGAMSSFIAAATSYATHAIEMIPFFIFYAMFGFQRVGDLVWAAADSRAKGFMLGATAGRTTLNGEGLQHQDGHSHLLASVVPQVLPYDPGFAYETAVIVESGMRRMYEDGEELLYYITLYNENYAMPPMPDGVADGILKGIYRLRALLGEGKRRAQILASGPLLREALRAQEILSERYDVAADVWSATSYALLRRDALAVDRWNRLHPGEPKRRSFVQQQFEDAEGPCVAASDYVKLVPDQIAHWVPGGLTVLGTDGFGRSDTRPGLSRYYEVDAESIVIATLDAMCQRGDVDQDTVRAAITDLGVDPDQPVASLATA